ncbi:translation initiation factor IF-2-like isoform X2 [Aquila chrysaetos chrysaetos]|uniref:translation initiation factor IF-2-like isoform X2 n=1 Tax=Aquila chrysaetos chrysaetos TaxID=223781 RepID=UPI001176B6B3|nr:translation initiation factor IF-2-like isoform X2 [Aquila chrysaetos chrysaetos]
MPQSHRGRRPPRCRRNGGSPGLRLPACTTPGGRRGRQPASPLPECTAPRSPQLRAGGSAAAGGGGARAAGVASAEPQPGRRGRAGAPGGRPARRGAPRLHLRRPGTPPGRGQWPMSRVGMSFGVTGGCGGGGPEEERSTPDIRHWSRNADYPPVSSRMVHIQDQKGKEGKGTLDFI